MPRKRTPLAPIEGLEDDLISAEMIDGLMPVNLVDELDDDATVQRKLEQRRYDRARRYLVKDANTWYVSQQGLWVRSFKGQKLYYYVFKDSMKLPWPGRPKPVHLYRAFERLYMMLHTDGFEENMIVRKPRKKAVFALPDPDKLTPTERTWLKNVPPSQDTLRLIFGWDADWQTLYYANMAREIPEIVPPRPFVMVDGVPYATAAITSMLLYGNPHGVPDAERAAAILGAYPKVTTADTLGELLPNEKAKDKRPLRKRVLTPQSSRRRKYSWRDDYNALMSKEPPK